MLDRCNQTALSFLFGCLACLAVTSVANADGRVFVLDLRNSSGLQGFRHAERACASQHARLASAAELRHAVVECFFSQCTRGWLYGGTVGTTVCNVVGSSLKAVDVRTENATEDVSHLDAFCVKDKGVPCGDPPAFPNARLQDHSGYELGDELLYTCVPGYVMPSGHSAFSLLCDSCGEWYGLVELCVKDETESHVDYEDKFPDSYGEAERHGQRPEEAHGEVYEEVHTAGYPEEKISQEQQETSFSVEEEEEHQDQTGEHDEGGEFGGVGGEKEEEPAVEGFVGHPKWEQGRREVATADVAATTQAPVSLLSQKHLFWFPSEAFQDEGRPASTNPASQTTQRASGAQSEESKEHESQERQHHQRPVDVDDDDHAPEGYDDHDVDDRDDHDDSNHDDLDAHDAHDDSHHDDQDEHDSHQGEDDHDDHVQHHIPARHDDLDRRDRHEYHDDHDDHYDMGEHEEDRNRDHDRVRYGSQEYDDRDDTYDEHESYEDHGDVTDDPSDDHREHPDISREDPDHDDHDDGQEEHDLEEPDNDHHTDHDDHNDHEHDDHDSYDDHDSHEDVDDGRQHVIFSIGTDERRNVTQKGEREKATTDETWLDGYPVVPAGAENGDATTERVKPGDRERGTVVRTTDKPNEVEIRKPGPGTSSPLVPESPTVDAAPDQGVVGKMWPTGAPSEPSDSPSYSDTLDYDTQQAAPTHSWLGDLTEHPHHDHDAPPPVHDGGVLTEEHTVRNLPGEAGERGEVEGELGETICTGEDCPPPSSSSRGPTVAAIIVALCAVAVAVIVGVWCYRRQQQKSSMYEMNGKGQSQTRQGQQIEMQQKV